MSGSGWQREATRNAKLDAAIHNELKTRDRVMRLESTTTMDRKQLEKVREDLSDHVGMGFWARLRWLLLGLR